MEDSRIIALYNDRDESAISETSEKYGEHCRAIAYNILNSTEDSEECVNDTWLSTWNSIPPSQPHSLRCFVSKIVRNLSLDRYRYKHRDKRGGGEMAAVLDEIDEIVASTVDVEGEIAERELARAINRFLRSLPARERDMFLRRYYFADAVVCIAQRHGMSESNVCTVLFRIREKLKKYLEREGYTV